MIYARRLLTALLITFVLVGCATIGKDLQQDLLAVGVTSNESAQQAYRSVRIAWHEGKVSDENMARADELYSDFVVLIKAYKFMLETPYVQQKLTYAEIGKMEKKLLAKREELEDLAKGVID